MKVEILGIQQVVDKYMATVVVTKRIWWWGRKYTAQHLIWGNRDGTVWRWHATRKQCPEWLELKLWVEWSKRINEGEKNARSVEH